MKELMTYATTMKKEPFPLNCRSIKCFRCVRNISRYWVKTISKILGHYFNGVAADFGKLIAHCVASIGLGNCYT